jgi:hypothetical protein
MKETSEHGPLLSTAMQAAVTTEKNQKTLLW